MVFTSLNTTAVLFSVPIRSLKFFGVYKGLVPVSQKTLNLHYKVLLLLLYRGIIVVYCESNEKNTNASYV